MRWVRDRRRFCRENKSRRNRIVSNHWFTCAAICSARCAAVYIGVLGDGRALQDVSIVCGCERSHARWAILGACVANDCVWAASGHCVFCDFWILHSPPLSWRAEDGGWALLFAPLYADPDPGCCCDWCLSICWAAHCLVGRAFDFVGIAAVEFVVRGDLLRGVSVTAATATYCKLATDHRGDIRGQRRHCSDTFSCVVMA